MPSPLLVSGGTRLTVLAAAALRYVGLLLTRTLQTVRVINNASTKCAYGTEVINSTASVINCFRLTA